MNLNNLIKILICFTIVVNFGCVAGNPGCGMMNDNGELKVTPRPSQGSTCFIDFTYNNISERTVKPEIQVTLFDGNGNTIQDEYLLFSNISPGRNQILSRIIFFCNGRNISKIHVNEAVDKNKTTYEGRAFRICGVYDQTYGK